MANTKKKSSKYLGKKKIILSLLLIIGIILIIWYILSWYNVKKQEKLMNSYLLSTNTLTYEIKEYQEISQVLKESPNSYFVLISYTENEDTYKLEKNLKRIIDNYELSDEFYYMNVIDDLDSDNLLKNLNDAFNTKKISNVPCILYYKDGKIADVIVNKKEVFNASDFEDLLIEYEYEKKAR